MYWRCSSGDDRRRTTLKIQYGYTIKGTQSLALTEATSPVEGSKRIKGEYNGSPWAPQASWPNEPGMHRHGYQNKSFRVSSTVFSIIRHLRTAENPLTASLKATFVFLLPNLQDSLASW